MLVVELITHKGNGHNTNGFAVGLLTEVIKIIIAAIVGYIKIEILNSGAIYGGTVFQSGQFCSNTGLGQISLEHSGICFITAGSHYNFPNINAVRVAGFRQKLLGLFYIVGICDITFGRRSLSIVWINI